MEDHGDLVASDLPQRHLVGTSKVNQRAGTPREADGARERSALLFHKAHDRQSGHGLARPGLADDGQRLAFGNVESKSLDCLHDAARRSEEDA